MQSVNRLLYWPPRVLSILFISFLALFSLDVFTPGAGVWAIVMGLVIHNIPVIILAAVIVIAWRYEWIGGVAFLLAGIAYIVAVANRELPWYISLSWSMTIAGPAFLIAALFFANWFMKDRRDSLSR